MSSFYWLVVASLVVWRVTHLLQAEDGPWNVVARLRRYVGDSYFGDLLDCFYCLSLWIALPFAFIAGSNWKERILLWPAVSGAAILLERFGDRSAPPVVEYQQAEPPEVLQEPQPSTTEQLPFRDREESVS
jgi:hypothetical protein